MYRKLPLTEEKISTKGDTRIVDHVLVVPVLKTFALLATSISGT